MKRGPGDTPLISEIQIDNFEKIFFRSEPDITGYKYGLIPSSAEFCL